MAAFLGAPEGGALAGPPLEEWLGPILAAWPGGRTLMSPALLRRWGARIRDLGGDPAPVAEGFRSADGRLAVPAVGSPLDQIWLDLGESPESADDYEYLNSWLAHLGAAEHPPLVVLLRDDAPSRTRTLRLVVDRPGRVLLLRETAPGGNAYVLGQPALLAPLTAGWNREGRPFPPVGVKGIARMRAIGAHRFSGGPPFLGRGRLVVLDVDGVLIDPGRAFLEAVAGALEELAPDLAWSDQDYLDLKRAGGFNNDFRLAAAALAMGGRGGAPDPSGTGGADLEARIRAWEPACQDAVRRQYRRTRRMERPLVRREDLEAFPGDLAVFTGRPPEELEFAFETLGFRLPAVGDRAPHLRKPRPEGLIQLADTFRAEHIVFAGDSLDDAEALDGARALRPDLRWTFGAVGPDRARIARDGALQAAGVLDLLALVREDGA